VAFGHPGEFAVSIVDVPAVQYHRDDFNTPEPSLSASIAKTLISESPAHAKAKHPRLTDYPIVREADDALDLGTVVHAILLDESVPNVDVYDYDAWRSNDAKAAKAGSLSAGRIPMKRHDWERALTVAENVKEELRNIAITPRPLTNGKPEQTLTWMEGDVYCRARLDWLSSDHTIIDDLKTSSRSANPHGFDRTLFSMGYDISAAFYLRGVRAVTGVDAVFRWVVVETTPPYALSVLTLAPDALALADAKVDHAIKVWGECLAANRWPGYSDRLCHIEAPPWEEARWLERAA
jgi:hypothetical protein